MNNANDTTAAAHVTVTPAGGARELAALIRQARTAAGLTQTELAQRMGTTQSSVAAVESGTRTPTVDLLSRAAHACGLHLTITFAAASSPAESAEHDDAPDPDNPYGVARGQIWEDTDTRMTGRKIRVDEVEPPHALCTVITDRDGKTTKITLTRFTPRHGWRRTP